MKKKLFSPKPTAAMLDGSRRSWWLTLLTVLLLCGVISPADAQMRDVITFTGGQADPNDANIYVIDAGDVPVSGIPRMRSFPITLSRPQGTSATQAATIRLREFAPLSNCDLKVTFEPGETVKTINVETSPYKCTYASGNLPVVFNVFATEHAEAAYQVLVVKMNTPAQEWMELEECTLATPLEVLQNAVTDFGADRLYRWGEYALLRLEFTTPVKIQPDSRYVLQVRETDHTGLAIDADDWGQSKTREVELKPLNAGSVCTQALFLYRPTDDELLNFLYGDGSVRDQTFRSEKEIRYHVLETGPFEVANPMEGGIKYISYSRTDMENAKDYCVIAGTEAFQPVFTNVSINKSSFKSGETMVITAKMDNWQIVKRARQEDFIEAFGVTLDGSETFEPNRASFDEATGMVTFCVTAPTVAEASTVHVDFGPVVTVTALDEWENEIDVQKVIPGPGGSFAVNVSSEAAPEVHATSIDLSSLPPDGSVIIVNTTQYADFVWRSFPLAISFLPANATDASEVTYTVENMGGANASIGDYNGQETLYTENEQGTITVKATLPSGVSTQRTYALWVSPPGGVHHTNTFLAGTTFTKFEFEIKNDMGQVKDDKVTINYTHANGTTWKESYPFSELKRRRTDAGTTCYMVPFNFTEEHPEPTSNQVGEPIITAKAQMEMTVSNGTTIPVEATATLMSELRKPSFDDYSIMDRYYTETRPATFTTDVSNLPRKGFTVGYHLPDLNVKETYSNLSGDPVPDWLTLEEDGEYYYTAHINVQLDLNGEDAYTWLYTMAQRSYIPDEAMESHLTRWCQFHYAKAEDNIIFRVNGVNANGDLTFDNSSGVASFVNKVKSAEDGILWSDHVSWVDILPDRFQHEWYLDRSYIEAWDLWTNNEKVDDIYDEVNNLVRQTQAMFEVGCKHFNGVELTLKRGQEVIQTIKSSDQQYYWFIPPSDGCTYTVEVYYPAYDKRYTTTFVSAPFSNVYALHTHLDYGRYSRRDAELLFTDGITDRNIGFWGGRAESIYHGKIKGFIYAEDPHNFYIHEIPERQSEKGSKIRVALDETLMPIALNPPVALAYFDPHKFEKRLYGKFHGAPNVLTWEKLISNNTQITVVNSQGVPITNATLNYACVDKDMTIQGDAGSTVYDPNLNAYQVSTDPGQHAQLIEVVAPGYDTQLATMYLWNYDYNSSENRRKVRRHTIVLQEQEALHSLDFETMRRSGNLANNEMTAEINAVNLLMMGANETLDYTQTADYATVTKHMKDPKFGTAGWSGLKYVHLTGMMPYTATPNLTLTTAVGATPLQPTMMYINREQFTTFQQDYCLFDFDLTDQIADNATVQPVLKNGSTTLAALPKLHNHTVDLMALNEASNIEMSPGGFDLREVDNDAAANGVDMKDMNKAFDSFDFQLPPVLPFTVNIERDGDHFMVRAVCEVNFLPGGPILDQLDKLENLQYFEEQFSACMDAVNTAKPADDDFFDDIPRWPSAFCGIKGYLSGIAHYNPETGKLDINFLDGGLTFEASAAAQANVSFGLGGFGMSVDAKIAMSMGLVNTAAEVGDVASTKIDFVFDYQTRLKVCAWAYGGIDLWIAKAVAGVRGGACIDLHHRAYVVKHQTGMKTSLQAKMEAYAEARFLFWTAKKSWNILNAKKEWLTPNNSSNPFHPSNPEPVFSMSRQNVTKGYKKLRRKVIADLGTPIISDVNGMAQPTYLLGGQSLLFNNLKTASDYNDDRVQVYSNGGKNNLVDTGISAPMYDFAEAHNSNGFEIVAFEQIKETLDGAELDVMEESGQIKTVTEKSQIHVAMRQNGGTWTTEAVGTYWNNGIACVTPAVTVTGDNKAALIWQQGVAKFNDQGERYIDGSLMLSRYDGSRWGGAIEIKRLNSRSVPADYQVSINGNEVLVMMTLQQDVNNPMKQASVVYITIDGDDKVRERYTLAEGSKPQMVSVNGANLVGFLKVSDEGRDIELSTVDMKGEPTDKLTGLLGMKNRMVNDFRLVVDDEGTDLSDVALLWSQSDQEQTDNGDGTMDVKIKNRIYASKLCSNDNQLYFSTPVEIATMPDDVTLVSMDGYLDGLDMKVAYCVSGENDGSAVMETPVAFTNAIDHKVSFNPYEVDNEQQVPVTITVANNGFEPIESIDVTMDGESFTKNVTLMPQETTELNVDYPVDEDFDGTISYEVAANFTPANSNALRARGKKVAARPHRIQQSGMQVDVRQVDMALKVLSKKTDATGVTTIVAEVNNVSLLPLASEMSVKVGLYNSPIATETAAATTTATVSASDLYDASSEQKNKVKIVTLTATQPDFDQVLYLRTTPMQGVEAIKDVRPVNNVLPVRLVGKHKFLRGDVNRDGSVSITDVTALVSIILGKDSTETINYDHDAADVNTDTEITIADVTSLVNIILGKNE